MPESRRQPACPWWRWIALAIWLLAAPTRGADLNLTIQLGRTKPELPASSLVLVYPHPPGDWTTGPVLSVPTAADVEHSLASARQQFGWYFGPWPAHHVLAIPQSAWQKGTTLVVLAKGKDETVYGARIAPMGGTEVVVLENIKGSLEEYRRLLAQLPPSTGSQWTPPAGPASTPNPRAEMPNAINLSEPGKARPGNDEKSVAKPQDAPPTTPAVIQAEQTSVLDSILDFLKRCLLLICVTVALASPAVIYYYARRDIAQLRRRIKRLELKNARLKEDARRKSATERPAAEREAVAPVEREPARESVVRQTAMPTRTLRFTRPEGSLPDAEAFQAGQMQMPLLAEPAGVPTEPGDVFRKWCQEQEVHIHSLDRFRSALQQHFAGAEVFSVYRDRNDSGSEYRLSSNKARLGDPVEYWCVDYQGALKLLPKPESSGFRELRPIFEAEGSVPPQNIEAIEPALLARSGEDGYAVTNFGRIS